MLEAKLLKLINAARTRLEAMASVELAASGGSFRRLDRDYRRRTHVSFETSSLVADNASMSDNDINRKRLDRGQLAAVFFLMCDAHKGENLLELIAAARSIVCIG